MASEFSLGDAIVKSPSSPVHAPETWRRDLLHKHLDSAGRRSVALTCKGALAWVLQDWPDATLTVQVRSAAGAERPEDALRRLQGAKRSLAMRGTRPTTLALQQEGSIPEGDAWWVAYLSALSLTEPAPHISLSLQLSSITAVLLSLAGQAFQGLQSLTLNGPQPAFHGTFRLPLSSALPTLRHLTLHIVDASQDSLFVSVRQYLPQLVNLSIQTQAVAGSAPFVGLFQPASARSDTLRRLKLPCDLGPQLLAALQQGTPALTELTVPGVAGAATGAAAVADGTVDIAAVWGWSKLTLTDDDNLPASAWDWLPMSDKGKLVIELLAQEESRCVCVPLPLTDAVALKLTSIELTNCDQISVSVDKVPVSEQPAALRAHLPRLAPLRSLERTLTLNGCTMQPALAAELATAGSGWEQVSLQSLTWPTDTHITTPFPPLGFLDIKAPLTDTLLAQLQQCVTGAAGVGCTWLYVPSVALTAPAPAGAVSTLQKLCVEGAVSVGELVKQAQLVGDARLQWACTELTLCLSLEEVQAGVHRDLARELSKVQFASIDNMKVIQHGGATAYALLHRASMHVLAALPCKPTKLSFEDWYVSPETVSEFQALLHMPVLLRAEPKQATLGLTLYSENDLDEDDIMWPVARLPAVLPVSFCTWVLETDSLCGDEVEAFMLNAPATRTAAAPLTIEVQGMGSDWVQGMNARLQRLGSYRHVTVVHKD